MLIYHPSNNKFDIVKIQYFGENPYTQRDVKSSPVLRTFWYSTLPIPETRLQYSTYIYVANIQERDIYDLALDEKNFKHKFNTIDKLLKFLKIDYLGVKYKVGSYDMIAIFKDIKPIARLRNREDI